MRHVCWLNKEGQQKTVKFHRERECTREIDLTNIILKERGFIAAKFHREEASKMSPFNIFHESSYVEALSLVDTSKVGPTIY